MDTKNINKIGIKDFLITGLFSEKNVHIEFDDNIMIIVGENGLGKTTILNIFYYTLLGDFDKLLTFDFKEILLNFHDNSQIKLKKDDINKFLLNDPIDEDMNLIKSSNYERIIALAKNIDNLKSSLKSNDISERIDRIKTIKKELRIKFKDEIIYLPTYRRVEEDLHKLYSNTSKNEKKIIETEKGIIQFGMNDVKSTLERLLKNIRDSSLNGYTNVTGSMITNLLYKTKGHQISRSMKDSLNDLNTIEIILSRLGNLYLSNNDKQKIKDLIVSQELFINPIYYPLVSLLSNLVEAYNNHQRKIDQSINMFVNTCNNYLVNKYFEYDKNELSINVFDKKEEILDLSHLSSGEKQIVSIFAKLYLSGEKEYIIIFDEPELSLSIDWQEKLLVDIVESQKCLFLFVVTHSPFIFNNFLKKHAKGVDLFIEEYYDPK